MRVRFSNNLPPKGKLLIIILLIASVSIILTYITGGLFLSIIAAIISMSIIYLSKAIWLPEDHGKTLIRRLSLWSVLVLSGSYSLWAPFISSITKQAFPNASISQNSPSIAVLVFAFFVIFIVNYFMRDTTVMKQHQIPIEDEFPEKDFQTQLEYYAKVIANDLNNIDIETNWTDYNFTPIDAEVEIINDNVRRKKVTDLLKAIRADITNQVFLVIGDPGSGKSIALRKLAKDLLKEVKKTGKLPIYINLKEWQTTSSWSKENPPNPSLLYDFIINSLKRRGDVLATDFIDLYFKKMYKNGRIFFILDSFDEIPEVLDADERSWIIDELSDIIYKFLAGSHESRGVLSSRIFRKPTQKFKTKTILELRPFSELKIEETINRNILGANTRIFFELFKNRPELVPMIRNPFMCALMIKYLKENNQKFPSTQAELYENYIIGRLKTCEKKIELADFSINNVIRFATNLSYFLFSSEKYGLEIKIEEIKADIVGYSYESTVKKIIEILTFAKIGRLSPDNRFSFVHRRFNEYFVVKFLIDHPESIDFESIPNDSRWRDALILYYEVADSNWTKQISDYCWMEIQKISAEEISYGDKQFLRSIHCLRFLIDAFRDSKNDFLPFKLQLGHLVIRNIESDKNILLKKYSIEAIGLLNEEHIEKAIISAFNTNNSWLYEVAFKSSRHLARININVEMKIFEYLISYDVFELLSKRKELLFSTSLSDAFSNIRKKLVLKIFDLKVLLLGFILLAVGQLSVALIFTAYYLLVSKLARIKSMRTRLKYYFRNNLEFISIRTLPIFILMILYPYFFDTHIKFNAFQWLSNKLQSIKFLSYNNPLLNEISVYVGLVGAILIFPFIDFFFSIKDNLKNSRFNDFFPFFRIIFISVIFAGIVYLLYLLKILILVGKIFLFFICIVTALRFIGYGILAIKDIKKLKSLKHIIASNQVLERKFISDKFNSFNLSHYRVKFVELLQSYSATAIGEWPKGELPNHKEDKGSILLAKLEAKWIGLEI